MCTELEIDESDELKKPTESNDVQSTSTLNNPEDQITKDDITLENKSGINNEENFEKYAKLFEGQAIDLETNSISEPTVEKESNLEQTDTYEGGYNND